MSRCKKVLLGIILQGAIVLSLTACGQIAWKQGANADDLKRDEAACREQFHDTAAIDTCLSNKGWSVKQAQSQSQTKPVLPQREMRDLTTHPVAATPENPQPIDPLATANIQSWWKVGAQSSDYFRDEAACVAELGAAHRPDAVNRIYTQGLIACLNQRGWSGK